MKKTTHFRSNSDSVFFFEKNLIEEQESQIQKIHDIFVHEKKRIRKTSILRNFKCNSIYQKYSGIF